MHEKIYRGTITCEQFLFYEMRTTAKLYCETQDRDEIIKKIQADNLFQFPTERSVKRIAKACLRRLDGLESIELVQHLAESSTAAAKQINLYAIMLDNAIIWDFMTLVIGEKFRTQNYSYSTKDLNIFFFDLQKDVPKIQDWSDKTIQKIKQVINKILVECNYLDSTRSDYLNYVFLYPELEQTIRNQIDLDLLAAFNTFQ